MNNNEIENFLGNFELDEDSDEGGSKSFFDLLKIIKDKNTFNSTLSKGNENNAKRMGLFRKIKLIDDNILEKNEYIDKAYVLGLLLCKMGYKFSRAEYTRLFLCGFISTGFTSIVDLAKSYMESQNKDFQQEEKKIFDIISDNKKAKEFVANYYNNSFSKNWKDVFDLFSKIIIRDRVSLNPEINRNVGYISYAISNLYDSYEVLSIESQIGMKSDLKKAIYDGIPKNIPRKNKPYELYINYNKNVVYSSAFFLWKQNISIEPINNIYYRSFTDVSSKDNDITCKNWSEGYAYLLNEEGFRAYVSGKRLLHRKVVFFDDDNNMYVADGTDSSFNKHQLLDMSDITRSKMEFNPALFYMVDADEKGRTRNRYYYNGEFLPEDEIIKIQGTFSDEEKRTIRTAVSLIGKYKIKNFDEREAETDNQENIDLRKSTQTEKDLIVWRDILRIVEKRNDIPELFKDIPGATPDEINLNKLKLINLITMDIASKYKADDSMVYDCLRNLIYILYKKGGLKLGMDGDVFPSESILVDPIKLSNNLYRVTNTKVEIVPLLYIKQGKELRYYIWDKLEGLKPITKSQVIFKIETGELHSRNNNRSLSKYNLDRKVIEGIKAPYIPFNSEVEVMKSDGIQWDKFGWEPISFDDYFCNECSDFDFVDDEVK